MAMHTVPLSPLYDQVFDVAVEVDGHILSFIGRIRYNDQFHYWSMDISDGITGKMFISSMPLVTGEKPHRNILKQFKYLGIGSVIIERVVNDEDSDYPIGSDLGSDFLLTWGDSDAE